MPSNKDINVEVEVTQGIEDICEMEIHQKIKSFTLLKRHIGAITFEYSGRLSDLMRLKTANAAYIVQDFDIPRPKALMGHQNITKILDTISHVTINDKYKTLTISAAGSDSSVMTRFKEEISQATSLQAEDTGDLLLRVRKKDDSWQVLTRTTPRPLATRSWRLYDMPGALNGPVAYAMNMLLPGNVTCINFMCGSGTLMAERPDNFSPYICGLDIDAEALALAKENLNTANIVAPPLILSHATTSPFKDSSIDALTADLPFGQLKGSHKNNQALYPRVLKEMWRVLKTDGIAVLITHEVRLMENLLRNDSWYVEQIRKVSLRGLHPRIYVLRKNQRPL